MIVMNSRLRASRPQRCTGAGAAGASPRPDAVELGRRRSGRGSAPATALLEVDSNAIQRRRQFPCAIAFAGLTLTFAVCATARAQDAADEFGDKPPAKAEERTLRPSNDPAVRALLATNPTTPIQLLKAIDILIDLRALDDAYALLTRLTEAKPDDDAWAELVEKVGSAFFLRLALIKELQPEGRRISDAALAAAERRARDPARLAKLIDQLKDPSPAVRRGAMTRLLGGREAAMQALIAALIDPARSAERQMLQAALARFGGEAVAPLTAIVRSPRPAAQIEAMLALAVLGQAASAVDLFAPALLDGSPQAVRSAARDALVALIDRVPRTDEAVTTLSRQARSGFSQALQDLDIEASDVPQWTWDEPSSTLRHALVPPRAAHLDRAADLAGDGVRLAPRDRELIWLSLAARLEAEGYRAGNGEPAPSAPDTAAALLATEDVDVVEGLLDFSLANGHTVAATAAVRALGEVGGPELLYRGQPRPSSLVEAARGGDRRLRFAALETIVRLKPERPYPGSSLALEALGYLAGSFAAPRVMTADARTAEAETQAGLLAALGFETDVATSEREVVAETISSPDYLFALIDYSLASPTSGQLLQRLRRDNRTAQLPIGIIASTDDLERARRLSRQTPFSAVIYRPVDAAGLDGQLQRLLAQTGRHLVPPEQRRQQARQALEWLAQIAAKPQDVYNLRRIEGSLAAAVRVPELSQPAAKTLAALGTPASQKALLEVASQLVQSVENRQAAARAFAESVSRFGTLLTTTEINQQYQRYNDSERQEADTQALLGSLLDAIEARAAAELSDD